MIMMVVVSYVAFDGTIDTYTLLIQFSSDLSTLYG